MSQWLIYGKSPSLDTLWDEELNVGRSPATIEAIMALESRLQIVLPDWLRQLYSRYDGGAVRMARGASLQEPENWLKADWLIPRGRLFSIGEIFSFAELRLLEDYKDDAFATIVEDDSRLIAIAMDEGTTTLCLDYSDAKHTVTPRIVLTDRGRCLRVFDDVKGFLAELVDVQYWNSALEDHHGPDPDPDVMPWKRVNWELEVASIENFFTGSGTSGAPASEDLISATENRLGVQLPALLKKLYRHQDGGYTNFELVPLFRKPSRHRHSWESAIIDRHLYSMKYLETLAEIASGFDDNEYPLSFYRMHAHCEWLVVLCSHGLDWMLCLDYRRNGPNQEPEVVLFQTFDRELEPLYRARNFNQFFGDLRRDAYK
ncbi:SMI1 / KNR4 family (SUKH-1) [compost metagenome]